MSRLFSRHTGRHCPRGTSTGWSGLAQMVPAQRSAGVSRPRSTPLALCPVAEDVIPFAPSTPRYTRPYDKDAA